MRARYRKIVEWSNEDGCYVGTCPGFMYGGVHGADEMKVFRELCAAVREFEAYERKHTARRRRQGRNRA